MDLNPLLRKKIAKMFFDAMVRADGNREAEVNGLKMLSKYWPDMGFEKLADRIRTVGWEAKK